MGGREEHCIQSLVGQHEGNRPLTGPRLRCEYNVKISMKEMELVGMYWITWLKVSD
jgi:hypothetical protein